MPLPAVLALAGAAGKIGSIGGAIGSLFGGGNKKDPERIANAQKHLGRALAGSVEDAKELYKQKSVSATAVGRKAFQHAWDELVRQRPDIAGKAGAVALATTPELYNRPVQVVAAARQELVQQAPAAAGAAGASRPETRISTMATEAKSSGGFLGGLLDALKPELKALGDNVREDVAGTVQRIGAGATTAATQAIAPDSSTRDRAVTVPLTQSQMLMIGGALVALLVVVALVARRR